jgi:type IV secretory pathway protease TraF
LLEDGTLQQRINYGYLMKRVAASENDTVTIADDGVRVNGDLLPESRRAGTTKTVGRCRTIAFMTTCWAVTMSC